MALSSRLWLAAVALSLLACGGQSSTSSPPDAATDGTPDATAPDGSSRDSSVDDGGLHSGADAGEGDAGEADGGDADAATEADTPCDAGTIEFALSQAPGSPAPFCSVGCGASGAFSITLADGGAVDLGGFCGTSCVSCEPQVCPPVACIPPHLLGDGGVSFVWDGTTARAEQCGTPSRACERPVCAAPGSYLVTMCGAIDSSGTSPACSSVGAQTCVTLPFVWPPSGNAVVRGQVGVDGD